MSLNCWQFKKCGREMGGQNVEQLGVCPAAMDNADDGKNQGDFAGRCCWSVAGTLCGGKIQGTFAQKLSNCGKCDFYQLVQKEEAKVFQVF